LAAKKARGYNSCVRLSRPALATVLGTLVGLCPSCSVADLTSGLDTSPLDANPLDAHPLDANPLDATGDRQPGHAESGVMSRDADAVKGDAGDAMNATDEVFVPPTTVVSIQNLLNLRYLDVAMSSQSLGAQVWAYSYTGGTNQLWTFMPMNDGTYEIVNQNSNDCLDVPGNSTTDGTSMQQYFCWGLGGEEGGVTNVNQRWSLFTSDGGVHIVGKGSGKCLASSAQEDEANVYIWECNSAPWENWAIPQ